MRIHIEIEQIDNGFNLTLFDQDGPSEHDEDLFVETLDKALKRIDKWVTEITEREANGDEEA